MSRKHLALSLPAVLLLAGCGGGEGIGDSSALEGLDVHMTDEGAPEVVVKDQIETDEKSALVIDAGDGEAVDSDTLIDYSQAAVDPSSGAIRQETYTSDQPSLIYLPQLEQSQKFIHRALTETGLNVGGEVAVFQPGSSQGGQSGQQMPQSSDQLFMLQVEEQITDYATGEEVEQSGDLPTIESTRGEAPALPEAPGDDVEKPSKTTSEVILEGDGETVGKHDTIVARYSGWKWSDGKMFDSSWPGVDVPSSDPSASPSTSSSPSASSQEEVVPPMATSLDRLVPGWAKALAGKQVGDRVVAVVPPADGYGQNPDHELKDETLIFVVDILATYPPQGQQGSGSGGSSESSAPSESSSGSPSTSSSGGSEE